MERNSLKGKVIAVTGGASGIGLGIVKKLILLEARVAVADVSDPPKELENMASVLYTKVDVSSRTEVHDWVQKIVKTYGRLDGMCANAGIAPYEGLTPIDDSIYKRIYGVCTTGVWNCGTEAYWQFGKQGGGGSIVTTSSGAGLRSVKGQTAYSSAKAAVIGLTRAWALDWASEGVRVNSLAPGLTSSAMQRKTFEEFGLVGEELFAGIPMGRMGQPNELADTVIFLLGDTASFITGSVISCDGGSMSGL